METETSTTVHTCTCTTCNGLTFTATGDVLTGCTTDAQRAEAVHTYAQYAHGTSPLASVMRSRYGVVPA